LHHFHNYPFLYAQTSFKIIVEVKKITELNSLCNKYGGYFMVGYITDLTIVALLIIGITALMGVLTNGFGEKVLGGKNRSEFVDQSAKFQTGWKSVGGKKSK
jgi:hypothetical protein